MCFKYARQSNTWLSQLIIMVDVCVCLVLHSISFAGISMCLRQQQAVSEQGRFTPTA